MAPPYCRFAPIAAMILAVACLPSQARAQTPYKKYKLTEEDFRNREKWPDYCQAVHEMVVKTSTSYAPWHLVPANDKRYARIQVLRAVVDRLETRLEGAKPRRKGKKEKKGKKRRKGKKS